MEADFWLQKWKRNEIGFHEPGGNSHLISFWHGLRLPKGSRVFVPLCGKTRDIAWLLSQGHSVAGAELSELAIQQLFDEIGVRPEISQTGELKHYAAEGIDIFVGDIFELSAAILGPVDGIYDRAALIALPQYLRRRYAAHLMDMTAKAPQLLVCFEYDQTLINGPPFSVGSENVNQYYATAYDLGLVAVIDVPGGLKGKCPATESVWLLNRK